MFSAISILLALENIATGVLIIALAIPLLRRRVKMNHLYGVRFPKSYQSDELWYEINEYGAKRLIIWSIIIIVIGIAAFFIPFGDNDVLIVIFSLMPVLVVIPAIESYLYARRL